MFWYEHVKVDLEWLKDNNVEILYFSKCASQNNGSGEKPYPKTIVNDFESSSIICSRFNMFSTNASLEFLL
jgi:hypothetical protein